MASSSKSKSAAVRGRLGHPVIDSDGHHVEYGPRIRDYIRDLAGPRIADRVGPAFDGTIASTRWYRESPEQRREFRTKRSPFWGFPTKNTLDLATSMFPKLMYERLDEMGLDFCVLYPSLGLVSAHFEDDEVRRATCRALNRYCAEIWGEYRDRITPVATVPMNTPQEALEELEYAVNVLGLKAVLMASYVKRPIPVVARQYPEASRYAFWLDTFGIDSEYDYDQVWAKCQELKVVPSFHSHGEGWGSRTSISNYVYNHVGHFVSSADAVCKSLFLGGVTRRFPQMKFSFLEGGVGWARSLLADLIGHWEKRNRDALANYDPAKIDEALLAELSRRYGGKVIEGREYVKGREIARIREGDPSDDFASCAITRKEDFRELFLKPFFFGCEADDPVTASAFDAVRNPLSARINAIYGSDIGHFDVPDMSEVTAEAYEPVEHGAMTEDDFRDFVFCNPVKLWTALNPDFFKGTAVESAVSRYLARAEARLVPRCPWSQTDGKGEVTEPGVAKTPADPYIQYQSSSAPRRNPRRLASKHFGEVRLIEGDITEIPSRHIDTEVPAPWCATSRWRHSKRRCFRHAGAAASANSGASKNISGFLRHYELFVTL